MMRGIGVLATCLVLALGCATTQPLEPGDSGLVVTAADLAEFGLELPTGYRAYESFERTRYVGGVVMVEYELALPEDEPPFIYAIAELHRRPADACRSFGAGNLGIRLGGLGVTERNDLFQYGERSRFGLIENEAGPVGNLFSMCRSRTALLVMFVGIYFDAAEPWQDLIAPQLRALEAFEAANP